MSFEDFQQQAKKVRSVTETQRVQLKKSRQELGNVRRKQAQVARNVFAEEEQSNQLLETLRQHEKSLKTQIAEDKSNYAKLMRDELARLREFLAFTDPIDNIKNFSDHIPILLFPLRLETRFKKVVKNNTEIDQLWVRIFPDDIAIDTFESDLSATEVRNLQQYWINRWKAGRTESGNRGAWRNLVSSHGPGRSYWMIQQFVPDNIAEEPELDEGEIILVIAVEEKPVDPLLGAIVTYWTEVWKANGNNAVIENAWTALISVIGNEESAQAALETYVPANINDPPPVSYTREETRVKVEFLDLPIASEVDTKLHAWSQPPASTILPERFVLLCYRNGKLDLEPQLSQLVWPNLIVGPDPAAEQGEDFRLATEEDAAVNPDIDEGDLIFSEHMRWMFDFDEALNKGMGFKVNLNATQAQEGFDRLLVVGVKLTADKDTAQEKIEELFEHHHLSRKGMGILKQGTPTNNTEEDSSGYSWRHDPDKSFNHYFVENPDAASSPHWFEKSDGLWLEHMLGLQPGKFRYIDNYHQKDISEALAMQQALWPATMGHFMQSMMNPVCSDETIEDTRKFFTRYVNGRGCIPAIRVGKQPYGIFLATNFTGMRWFLPRKFDGNSSHVRFPSFTGGNSSQFLTHLYAILMDMDRLWSELTDQVSYVGKTGDAHQIILDIVGLHPTSVDLYKRYANTIKQVWNIYAAYGNQYESIVNHYPASREEQAALLARLGYPLTPENPAPKIFEKIFFEKPWILTGSRIDKVPNTETAPVSPYTEETGDKEPRNYIKWLVDAARDSHDTLRKQKGFIDNKPPTTLLYLLLFHSLDLSYVDTSLKLKWKAGILDSTQYKKAFVEPDFIHVQANRENESRWKHIYTPEPAITGDINLMLDRYIPLHIDELDEAAAFRDALTGMDKLVSTSTASLERTMLEHIDTVSYRYDAWLSGFTHLQLDMMRGLNASGGDVTARPGVYIGAYGWLEDLRPENKNLQTPELDDELESIFNADNDLREDPTNAGYILAPSQNHAITAAVLRNGHLSAEDPEDNEQLKIKLTSERVRLALQIIEGMQAGQSLAALLGYQFERGLHDRTDAEVDEFILDLRNAFPLVAKKIKDTTPEDDDPDYESIEQIEANNVLDGVAFLEHLTSTGNYSYPFGLSLPDAEERQQDAINDEVKKLVNTNDAVADLAMAESVHQVVMGNYERASAVLDTYSKGNFPSTPDVIKTPRSGIVLTHRFGLQFKTGIRHAFSDFGVTPRMFAEPAMHHWLASVLPPIAGIVCIVKYAQQSADHVTEVEITMADLGLAAIDLLYLLDVDNEQAMSALDDLIMQYLLATPSFKVMMSQNIEIEYTRKLNTNNFSVFEVNAMLGSLHAVLLKSRYLTPADVRLPNEVGTTEKTTLSLPPDRIQQVVDQLRDIKSNALQHYIDRMEALIAADSIDGLLDNLNAFISDIRALFVSMSLYGLTQTGIGFVYQWQQSMIRQLSAKVKEVHQRWQNKRARYLELRDEYTASSGAADNERRFKLLRKMELAISTSSSPVSSADPSDFYNDIVIPKLNDFESVLANVISPLLSEDDITQQFKKILILPSVLANFDLVGIDIKEELKQLRVFIDDLHTNAKNLSEEITTRTDKAQALLDTVDGSIDAVKNADLVVHAGKAIFGENFVMIPEFTLSNDHAVEWQNTIADSGNLLRYLETDLNMDFPLDDWFHGVSRVRKKLYHIENVMLLNEGFGGVGMQLVPTQFPYKEKDYWLGMQYPEKKEMTDEPFVIDGDKLLYTAIYAETYNPAKTQCGLLIDDWTEVIPSADETAGLTFHYDQPNSEPPQALLLVTPTAFTGSWQWDDLVNALMSTLDMAKKRAVEPDHLEASTGHGYNLFLPTIVSLASPMPVTASLNLALNNEVYFAKVNIDE